MATASGSGSGSGRESGDGPGRLRAPSEPTKATKLAVDGEHEDASAKMIDVEELRKRRLAYHAVPTHPRGSSALGDSVKTKVKTGSQGSCLAAATKPMSTEHRRKHRRHRSSTARSHKRNERKTGDSTKTEELVYTKATAPHDGIDAVQRVASSRSGRHSRMTSSEAEEECENIIGEELTPEDSISQVGQHASALEKEQARAHSASPTQTTATLQLPAIPESGGEACVKGSATSLRRPHKRESSIFGSLLKRKPSKPASLPTPKLVDCLTCGSDDVPASRAAKLACGHRMCHECLKRVFEMSVNDPAHMPPRCCTRDHIPLKHVDKLFDLKFKVLWNRKYDEFQTKNRIYCPAPQCGEWIRPSHVRIHRGRKYGQCSRCRVKVCVLCNGKMHKSPDCPKDPELVKLMEQAEEEGWQSCYNCHAMIELKEGCNHMTCRCQAEMCMMCGAKWKTCECPWFNYSDLPDLEHMPEMRIPEPVQVMIRRVFDAAGVPPPQMADRQSGYRPADRGHRGTSPQRQFTYTEELDHRRRQERLDAELARRMQLAAVLDPGDEFATGSVQRRGAEVEAWGLRTEEGHFMNDDYVNNASHVVTSAFGDAKMGRRGQRTSGRRRRARRDISTEGEAEPGLAPNFLGDENIVGREGGGSRRRS